MLESLKNFLTKIVHFVKKYSYTGQTRQHRRKKALVLHPSAVFLGCFFRQNPYGRRSEPPENLAKNSRVKTQRNPDVSR